MTRPLNPFESAGRVILLITGPALVAVAFTVAAYLFNPQSIETPKPPPPPSTIVMTFVPGGTR